MADAHDSTVSDNELPWHHECAFGMAVACCCCWLPCVLLVLGATAAGVAAYLPLRCCSVPQSDTAFEDGAPSLAPSKPIRADANSSHAAATLTALSGDLHELKAAFNEDKAAVKVLLIVSPTCPMCRSGAQVIEDQALTRIDSQKLKVYVVWIKKLIFDSRSAALGAMTQMPDRRTRHFWDPSGSLGRAYGKILDLPGKRRFAWDVYLVFDGKTRWGEAPPVPAFWMHQLGGSETGNRLEGRVFRDAIVQRLRSSKS
jgi:hypothetical protein